MILPLFRGIRNFNEYYKDELFHQRCVEISNLFADREREDVAKDDTIMAQSMNKKRKHFVYEEKRSKELPYEYHKRESAKLDAIEIINFFVEMI
jgi:hemerythrin